MSPEVVAYLLVTVELGKEYDVAGELLKMGGVSEVSVVYGEYDVFARVEAKDLKELDGIVTSVRHVPGILKTSTLVSSP